MGENIWRLPNTKEAEPYGSCLEMNLGNGILISKDIPNPVWYADNIQFQNYCYKDNPTYMAAKYVGIPGSYLPMAESDWKRFISAKYAAGRDFTSGIFPLLVSYSASFVLTLFLTILTFLIIRPKSYLFVSTLFKTGCLLCTINAIIALSRVFVLLRDQHIHLGVTISSQVMESLAHNAGIISLHFISLIILQLCQVFIVMRTFERNKEKRIILFCGIILIIPTTVLWAIPLLTSVPNHRQLNWDILPVFVYLFRIAMETLYTCFIFSFALRQSKFWLKNPQMMFLTLLTILSVLLLPGFFLADVSNLWISQLGELFTDACYISSTFLPWEWLERLSNLQRAERAQSILGKPIFDNEQQNFAFAMYTLKLQHTDQGVDDDYDDDDDVNDHMIHELDVSTDFTDINIHENSNTNRRYTFEDNMLGLHYSNTLLPSSGNLSNHAFEGNSNTVSKDTTTDNESINEINFNPKERKIDLFKAKFSSAYNNFILFTDHVILKKLGLDSLSSASNSDQTKISKKKQFQLIKRRIGLDKPPATYVYNTKDVVFDSDDSEDSDDSTDSHINSNLSLSFNDGENVHAHPFSNNNNTYEVYYSNEQPEQEDVYYDEDFERDFGKHHH